MAKLWIVSAAVLFVLPVGACGDDASGPAADTAPDTAPNGDTGGGDTTPADTTPADTTPADTTPADTTPADTTPGDTTPADTEPADTTPADTEPADTTPADTEPADTTPGDTTVNDTNDTTDTTIEGTSAQIQALIDAAAGATGPVTVDLQLDDATVTLVKPAIAVELPGFFLQGDPQGPAIFVQHAGAAAIVRNDMVSLRATSVTVAAGVVQVTEFTDLELQSGAGDADLLIQDVSAVDLVGGYAGLASEHVTFEGELVEDFAFAGEGYASAQIITDGVQAATENLKLRMPATLVAGLALSAGCLVEVHRGVVWRFLSSNGSFDQTQPSVFEDLDLFVVCDGPKLLGTVALSATEVMLTFDKDIDVLTVLGNGSQFTISNGLTVSSLIINGSTIKLVTSPQTPDTTYVVTIAASVQDLAGRPVQATPQAGTFTGFAGVIGLILNELDYDQPGDDVGEFVEIYNPGNSDVDLSGFKIEILNPTGAVVAPFDLSGTIPAKGYAVLANTAVSVDGGATTLRYASAMNNIQNGGQDGVRIITSAGVPVDGLMYETQAGSPPEVLDLAEGEAFAGGESNDPPNQSLARCPNATDTNNNATDFVLTATPTPGAANVCP